MSGLNFELLGEDSDEENVLDNEKNSALNTRRLLAQACLNSLKARGVENIQSVLNREAKDLVSSKTVRIADDIDVEGTISYIQNDLSVCRGGKNRGHKLSVTSVCQSGDLCFAGSKDGTLTAWQISYDSEISKYGLELKWSVQGQQSLRAHKDYLGALIRENLRTNQALTEEDVKCTRKRNVHGSKPFHPYCYERNGVSSLPPYEFGHFGAITCICASECGKYIISGGVDGLINIREVETGKSVFTFASAPPTSGLATQQKLVEIENSNNDEEESNEEKRNTKIMRDFSDIDPYAIPTYPTAMCSCSNNRLLVGLGKTLVVYSIEDRCELFQLLGHTDVIRDIKWVNYVTHRMSHNFSTETTYAITASQDGTVRYFDLLNQSHLIYDCPTPVYSVEALKMNRFIGTGPEGLYYINKDKAKPTLIAIPDNIKKSLCLVDDTLLTAPLDSLALSSGLISMSNSIVFSSAILEGTDLLLTGSHNSIQIWKIGESDIPLKEIINEKIQGYINDITVFKAYDEKTQTYHALAFLGLGQEPGINRMQKDITAKNGVALFELKSKTIDADGNLKLKNTEKKHIKSRFG